MEKDKNTYITSDIGHASALLCKGYELIDLDKSNPNQVKFILFRSQGLDNSINNYWNDSLKVYARAFYENLKMLKTRIFKEV